MTKDPRVDMFIEKAQPFAKPILTHLRKLVHTACPDVVETIKWNTPIFEYKGMLCGLGSFKQHCAFNIFKFKQMQDVAQFEQKNTEAGGQFGKLTKLEDLPPDEVTIAYIKEAMKLNENKVKPATEKKSTDNKIIYYPEGMKTALEANAKAGSVFDKMSYSHKKEYVEWIAEAKTELTRQKRIATMLEWLEEGKRKNWKYERR